MASAKAMDIDFSGADGGRMALAFAAGCAAAWAFLKTAFTSPLRQRVKDLENLLKVEQSRCEAMEARLVGRIQMLENILAFGAGPLRAQIQNSLSEMHGEIDTITGKR